MKMKVMHVFLSRTKQEEKDAMDSDDEYDDVQEDLLGIEPPAAKKQKIEDVDRREFNLTEINKLKNNETMFHSSLFRMQIAELIKSVSMKQKLRTRIESTVQFLTKILCDLPSGSDVNLKDMAWPNTEGFHLPVNASPKDTEGVFRFFPPSDVHQIGSISYDTCVKPRVEVDLALVMQKAFFEGMDFMNQRLVRKKACYLASLASHLSKLKKKIGDIEYSYHMGNPLRPVLCVSVRGEDSNSVKFKIHVVSRANRFKLSKFHIAKSNVNPKWFFGSTSETTDSDDDSDEDVSLPPTKNYNTSILQDMCMLANNDFIKETIAESEGLRQGIMLLKIWMHQRELSDGFGMFSNFLMTAYVAYLTKMRKLNSMMNNYQVFKTTLLCLSKADWKADPPSLCDKDSMAKSMPTMDEYKQAFDCVFVDSTGSYNLAYTLTESVFKRVKSECQASIDSLTQSEQTLFDSLFMTSVPFGQKFDHIFHVHVNKALLNDIYNKYQNLIDAELDMGHRCQTVGVQQLILNVLNKALSKRALAIQEKPTLCRKWSAKGKPFIYDGRSHLTFGIILDPSEAFNILTKGPAADDTKADEFRKFWGSKSEMRRFKDGSINEAVLWTNSPNQSERRIICQNIVSHILNLHCGIPTENILYRGDPLDSLLKLHPSAINQERQSYGTGEECSLAVLKAFEPVNRVLRALTDLPLPITSVQGVHPVFRHSEVFPPLATALRYNRCTTVKKDALIPHDEKWLPLHLPVLKVLCELEGTGKWPDDKDALESMKVLLHVKMGQELKQKFSLCVGIHPTHVDVYKDGFVFRLMLTCLKEIKVLRTVKTDSGMLRFEDNKEAINLSREILQLPLHNHLVHSVQQQHQVFSATVRLCKRWFSSQMVWHYIGEEAIELMVASVFINHHPYSTPPASPCVGFMRFLRLFSTFNWKDEILMVNFGSEFSAQDYSEIPQHFKDARIGLPAICIATPRDKKGNVWTSDKPDQFMLDRLVILAAASLEKLEGQLMSFDIHCDFKQIFRPPVNHFDLTIILDKTLNVISHQRVDGTHGRFIPPYTKEPNKKEILPVVDFDVYLKFFDNLQELYGDLAFFFYDRFGGNFIGLVWKPHTFDKKEFKLTNFAMHRPIDSESKVTLAISKDSIVDEIGILGSGIIKTITTKPMQM